jgi:Flp pilus assembly protein TadG
VYLKREDGAAAVEFALVLPILILILFGIIEFGFALYNKEVITNASREGARYGIIMRIPSRYSADEIKTDVVNPYLTNSGLDPSKAEINFPKGTCGSYPNPLEVEVKYPAYILALPGIFSAFDNSTKVTAVTQMVCE